MTAPDKLALRAGEAGMKFLMLEEPMAANRNLFIAFVIGFFAIAPFAHAQSALMGYCKPDVERLCPGVQMGGGRIIKCLKAHKNEMSVGCAKAIMKLKGKMG